MALSRREASELKFHQRQAKVLQKRVDRMSTTAAANLAKRLAQTNEDLQVTQQAIAELSAKA